MDQQHPPNHKPAAPVTETPVKRRGYSGRGAASALETLKKLERVNPKRADLDQQKRFWS
ncbi:hypothetical protein ACPWT1_22520 [Ramlibacter sp. MMS24-I3-19]|uniref:hypothetical protein n=1 Tax=Ramlibacter sp. MMS24-I3-19 TaxID=3416606 RepID=UPI003D0898DD